MKTVKSWQIAGGYEVEILQADEAKDPKLELVCIVKKNTLITSAMCRNQEQITAFVSAFLTHKGLA